MFNFSLFYQGLGAIIIVSLISFVGAFIFLLSKNKLSSLVPYLVSLAIGALLGDAVIHLLPEAFEMLADGSGTMSALIYVSISLILGFGIFYALEKYVHWHHHHDADESEHAHEHGHGRGHDVGIMVSIGDGIHNFIDGVIIGLAFLISAPVGFATTLAVVLHEIPQEIGDMGVLVFAGWSRIKALIVNFLSSCAAILGYVLAMIFGGMGLGSTIYVENFMPYLLAFAAGGFIYIAIVDLIPSLKVRHENKLFFRHIAIMLLGALAMASLLLFE